MAMENKRIIQLSTERLTLNGDDYVMVDSETDGSAKYRLDRLKETDSTLSVSGMAADAAATGQAISEEAQARSQAVTAETQARQQAITAESQARQAADTTLGNDVDDLKSATESIETEIEQMAETIDEKKADINGTYDDMTVGTAENVLSGKYALESVPYQFRKTGGDISVGSRLKEKIVGGTVAWNQQVDASDLISESSNGITITADTTTGEITVSGTANEWTSIALMTATHISTQPNHVYFMAQPTGASASTYYVRTGEDTFWNYRTIGKSNLETTTHTNIRMIVISGQTVNLTFKPQFIDLTQMFGTTIADHIYILEQTTAGAGVALFRKLFPKQYYPYNPGELLSVSGLVSHDEVGFNQWDEELELGSINNISGQNESTASLVRSKNYIRVLPGATYYFRNENKYVFNTYFYDSEKNYVSRGFAGDSTQLTFEVPSGCYYMRFRTNETTYGTVYKNDICINLSDPSKNGTYEPYKKHSYPLDSSLTLRGVPKLADNKIKFDGDWYESEGKKTERYTEVDLGMLNWSYDSTYGFFYTSSLSADMYTPSGSETNHRIICSKYITPTNLAVGGLDSAFGPQPSGTIAKHKSGQNYIYIKDTAYTDATTFKTAMSGVKLVYEKATPTTSEAQPFVNPQICDKYGTEEYVSTSIVPVGHETEYYEDVVAKVDGLPSDFSTLIAPTEVTYKATRNYVTGNLFIVDNILYKATANIANGGTITPNTNCTATTLAEIISALS